VELLAAILLAPLLGRQHRVFASPLLIERAAMNKRQHEDDHDGDGKRQFSDREKHRQKACINA
jgi:hypothetical protein